MSTAQERLVNADRKRINAALTERGARMKGDLWCGGSAYGKVVEVHKAEHAVIVEIDVLLDLTLSLERFRKNPVVLFDFDYEALPIARSMWERLQENHDDTWTLRAKVQFHLDTELSRETWARVRVNELSSWRVGVIPTKWDGDNVSEADLISISCGPTVSDRDALLNAIAPRNHEITVPAFMKVIREMFGESSQETEIPAADLDDILRDTNDANAPRATILLRDSNTSKRIRYTRWYHKGGCLCVELAGVRDEDGHPVIMEVPHEQYTYAMRPHLPHLGMEERE